MTHSLLKILTLSITLLCSTTAMANDVDALLEEKDSPSGVVFEIVSGNSGLLGKLLTTIKTDINRLRDRFPGLPVAIVTHGTEQFDLTTKNMKKEKKAHTLVEELVKSGDVDVHVCGTHASWYGVMPEDFPDYVDVSATGPAQINDYEELGYVVIVLP